jgi:hypothetical protein
MPLNPNDVKTVKQALAELEYQAMLYAVMPDPKITFIGQNTPVLEREIPLEVTREKGLSPEELQESADLRKKLADLITAIDYEKDSPEVVAQKCLAITDHIRTFPWHSPRGGTGNALNTFTSALKGTAASISMDPLIINVDPKHPLPFFMKPKETVKPVSPSSEVDPVTELKESARALIAMVTDPEVEGAMERLEGVLEDETTDLKTLVEASKDFTDAVKESSEYAPPARPKKNRDPDALPEVKKVNPLGEAVFRVDKALAQAEKSMLANRSGSSQRSSGSSAGLSANAQEVANQMQKKVHPEEPLSKAPKNK